MENDDFIKHQERINLVLSNYKKRFSSISSMSSINNNNIISKEVLRTNDDKYERTNNSLLNYVNQNSVKKIKSNYNGYVNYVNRGKIDRESKEKSITIINSYNSNKKIHNYKISIDNNAYSKTNDKIIPASKLTNIDQLRKNKNIKCFNNLKKKILEHKVNYYSSSGYYINENNNTLNDNNFANSVYDNYNISYKIPINENTINNSLSISNITNNNSKNDGFNKQNNSNNNNTNLKSKLSNLINKSRESKLGIPCVNSLTENKNSNFSKISNDTQSKLQIKHVKNSISNQEALNKHKLCLTDVNMKINNKHVIKDNITFNNHLNHTPKINNKVNKVNKTDNTPISNIVINNNHPQIKENQILLSNNTQNTNNKVIKAIKDASSSFSFERLNTNDYKVLGKDKESLSAIFSTIKSSNTCNMNKDILSLNHYINDELQKVIHDSIDINDNKDYNDNAGNTDNFKLEENENHSFHYNIRLITPKSSTLTTNNFNDTLTNVNQTNKETQVKVNKDIKKAITTGLDFSREINKYEKSYKNDSKEKASDIELYNTHCNKKDIVIEALIEKLNDYKSTNERLNKEIQILEQSKIDLMNKVSQYSNDNTFLKNKLNNEICNIEALNTLIASITLILNINHRDEILPSINNLIKKVSSLQNLREVSSNNNSSKNQIKISYISKQLQNQLNDKTNYNHIAAVYQYDNMNSVYSGQVTPDFNNNYFTNNNTNENSVSSNRNALFNNKKIKPRNLHHSIINNEKSEYNSHSFKINSNCKKNNK